MVKRKLIHKCHLAFLLLAALGGLHHPVVYAQKTECAEVKIVIEQKLAFERQAFDAKMIISNGLSTAEIKDIGIELVFLDKNEQLVHATLDPNDTGAKFFYKADSLTGIGSIEGAGHIPSKSSAEIHWLIIPSNHAVAAEEELYYVGAKVHYSLNDTPTTVEVTPDFIVVRPLPEISLDYFLPKEVFGNDPLTAEIEPSVPFTLGVRVKNSGYGPVYNLSIDSAQPKIVNNDKNLLVSYEIIGSSMNDQSLNQGLNIEFGNIMPDASKVGRWQMISSLSGEFTDFNATYTHADELGGQTTSVIKDITTHVLIHDVKSPFYEDVRGFLALDDNEQLRLYDATGGDTPVQDVSAKSQAKIFNQHVKVSKPSTPVAFSYLKVKDPFNGQKKLKGFVAETPIPYPNFMDNVWLSKEKNQDKTWSHYINIFSPPSSITNYSVIFAEEPFSSISGQVFYDEHNNGLPEGNDRGISGITVMLTGQDELGLNVRTATVTKQDGSFSFEQLNAGTYDLSVDPMNGVLDGIALSGHMSGQSGQGSIRNIQLQLGQKAEGNTFAKLKADYVASAGGETDLSVYITTQANSYPPKVGEVFSIYVSVLNQGTDMAKDSVVELNLPDNVVLVGLEKGYHMDDQGIIKLGNISPTDDLTLLKVELKAVNSQVIPLSARVSSQTVDADLKNNVYSTFVLPKASQ